jgi:CubicO group peptidase (beta-lactamase class C family)
MIQDPNQETMAHKFNYGCLKCSLSIIILLFLQPVFSQYDFSGLDNKLGEKQKLLGKDFVVLIWKQNDTLIYKKEVGEYKSKTVAPIASCSKWLTAALVMQFVDDGKISLDDPVVKYIPIFEKYMKSYITIRHCLSHLTGIESEPIRILKLLERKKFNSLEEEVNSFAAKEIQANAGTEFRYSNIGLNIAARVLEVVSKKKFDQLIRQKLFTPLGMRNTTFSTPDGGPLNPSGGAKSTADDYMKFLIMMMNKGNYRGKQILSEESVNEMIKAQTKPGIIKYAPKAAEGFNYALGSWVIEESKDGDAKVLSSPGLFGTWPMVDYCRGYAYILFVKNLLGDERADAHLEIKKVIDEQMKAECK